MDALDLVLDFFVMSLASVVVIRPALLDTSVSIAQLYVINRCEYDSDWCHHSIDETCFSLCLNVSSVDEWGQPLQRSQYFCVSCLDLHSNRDAFTEETDSHSSWKDQ